MSNILDNMTVISEKLFLTSLNPHKQTIRSALCNVYKKAKHFCRINEHSFQHVFKHVCKKRRYKHIKAQNIVLTKNNHPYITVFRTTIHVTLSSLKIQTDVN